ncbi:MAG: hypothetical protein V3U84_07005 [Thiotrichaceae bacterium]
MLWRDGDIIHFVYKGLRLSVLAEKTYIICGAYPSDQDLLHLGITWFEIEQKWLLDYIEYLFESRIDRQLVFEDRKRKIEKLKRSFMKKYPNGLVGNAPVLDRPLVDIIEENTVRIDDA